MRSSPARRSRRSETPKQAGAHLALAIFALITVAGPLLFGAVDRVCQIGLLLLLAIGVWARPPVFLAPSKWGLRLAIAFVAIVVLKEFAPSILFGHTRWRTVLARDYALDFPWTHHPEPGRSVDALLVLAAAAVWFVWVRQLAAEREHRPFLAWSIFASAAIVSVVSFATRGMDPQAIYGLRYTIGWTGFGPFPNRNHSADFFAIGAIVGCGCITWAGARKKRVLMLAGVGMLGLTLVALLTTESRGGLIVFVLGLALFCAFVIAKAPNRRALLLIGGAGLLICGLVLTVGSPLLARFHSGKFGGISDGMRIGIWKDAFSMWKDAPLFGHGLNSFAQIFPFYETVELENQVILHPESSWLLWLAEYGAFAVIVAVAGLALFLRTQAPLALARERSFYLSAGGLAAGALILVHSIFDVPAHRWGTAGLALAALAMACPARSPDSRTVDLKLSALAPLLIAVFWTLPLLFDSPKSSPLFLARLLARDAAAPASVSTNELESELRCFPLSPELHQTLGIRQAQSLGLSAPAVWQQHFSIAARLIPGSWGIVQAQARACQNAAPSLALHYWEIAMERGGLHRDEVLRSAFNETAGRSPAAAASWSRFIEANPKFLLPFAQLVPEPEARHYFALWWKERAFSDSLTPEEIEIYFKNGARWGDRAQLDEWMSRRAAWRERDFRKWAALLHGFGDDQAAWGLLSQFISEPDFPNIQTQTSRKQLEARWRINPNNFANAQELASARVQDGETAEGEGIVIQAAVQKGAPVWFLRKAAYALARQKRFSEAVVLMLKTREGRGSAP